MAVTSDGLAGRKWGQVVDLLYPADHISWTILIIYCMFIATADSKPTQLLPPGEEASKPTQLLPPGEEASRWA